ncbi:hypothetical protein FS837_006570, partial [Tulasnella sp. UAMH 9824]
DLFLLGQTAEGIDPTEFDNVPTELLQQYYGVHGPRQYRLPTETGAGHPRDEQVLGLESRSGSPMEEDDSDLEDGDLQESDPLEQLIANSIRTNIRHAPVKAQRHQCPFNTDQVLAFGQLLAELLVSELQPVDPDSWATVEPIPLGRRKELRIDLAGEIWKFRARKWVLGVELMTRTTD